MPTPAERLALLLEVHGDSYRSAAQLCGLDHTTLMRVDRGDSENPATLAKIAEAYGVPEHWMRGDRDVGSDFMFAVFSLTLDERVVYLWDRDKRTAFALLFLLTYDPMRYTVDRLAELLGTSKCEVEGYLAGGRGRIDRNRLEHVSQETGLPMQWFLTGLLGCEPENQVLVGLAAHALTTLAEALGVSVRQEEIETAARALI